MTEEHSDKDLECTNCGGIYLVDTFKFVRLKNQGFAKKPTGAICLTCGKEADQGRMNRKMELARKARELEELTKQAEALDAEQAKFDEESFNEDPVEMHELVVRRAKAVRAKKASPKEEE